MKIKTSELTGAALDWAVAVADKQIQYITFDCSLTHPLVIDGVQSYGPSFIWSQGGPIIEHEEIGIVRNAPCSRGREWEARPSITAKGAGGWFAYGPTPLIATMRYFVTSKLGDEVDVPKGLLT